MTKPKRKKPFAATRASTKMLEADGWTVGTVEQRIPHCFITRDFLGFADLIACSPSRGIMAVQATGGGNLSARAIKTRLEPRSAIWLAAGGRIQIHDWVKRKGQKQRECKVMEIQISEAENSELRQAAEGRPIATCVRPPLCLQRMVR